MSGRVIPVLSTITGLAAILAGVTFAFTIVGASGAPQQAAGAAMSMAMAVIPYVLLRAVEIARNQKAAAMDK